MSSPTLVLASTSPRRKMLLETLGLTFETAAPDVDESQVPGESPVEFVERVAREKVAAVHARNTVTVGADTTVVLDGEVLGKPTSTQDAAAMLRRLRGRTHLVHTGVAVASDSGTWSGVTTTGVSLSDISDERIDWYVRTGEPMDKAGSYALQGIGGVFVERVEGDPFNVIGLPLASLRQLFAAASHDLLGFRQ